MSDLHKKFDPANPNDPYYDQHPVLLMIKILEPGILTSCQRDKFVAPSPSGWRIFKNDCYSAELSANLQHLNFWANYRDGAMVHIRLQATDVGNADFQCFRIYNGAKWTNLSTDPEKSNAPGIQEIYATAINAMSLARDDMYRNFIGKLAQSIGLETTIAPSRNMAEIWLKEVDCPTTVHFPLPTSHKAFWHQIGLSNLVSGLRPK